MGLHRDSGKENGNYRNYWGYRWLSFVGLRLLGLRARGFFTVLKISEPGLRICACRLGISLAQQLISKTSNRVQGSLERNIEAM